MSLVLKALEVDQIDGSFGLDYEYRNVVNAFLTNASEPYFFAVPAGAKKVFLAGTGDFYFKAYPLFDFGVLATGLVLDGGFPSDTNWTLGDGASVAAGVATWDASQAADSDIEQDVGDFSTVDEYKLIEGRTYYATFTVSSFTAGLVTPVIGSTEGTDRGSAATFSEIIVAGNTQDIALRADASGDLSVDNFIVRPCAAVPTETLAAATDADGEGSVLNPTVRYLDDGVFISLVAPNANTIVSMAYYKDR